MSCHIYKWNSPYHYFPIAISWITFGTHSGGEQQPREWLRVNAGENSQYEEREARCRRVLARPGHKKLWHEWGAGRAHFGSFLWIQVTYAWRHILPIALIKSAMPPEIGLALSIFCFQGDVQSVVRLFVSSSYLNLPSSPGCRVLLWRKIIKANAKEIWILNR